MVATKIATAAVTSDKIAAEAVDLTKLPHGTSSNDGKFLRANNGADPTFETITGTTINNNAADRIITGEGGTTLNGESGLTYTGSRLTQSSGDTIIDQTNNGYGGLRIVDSSAGQYSVSYILGRNSGLSAHVFKYNGRTQNQSPWNNNGTGAEMGRWTAAGIAFNGDTAAANSLNDYEEGTFTPTISVEGQSSTSLAIAIGRYVKIGRTVHIHFEVQLNGTPSNRTTGNAWQWGGFPFNPVQYNSSPSGGLRDYRYPLIAMNVDTSSTYGSNGHFVFRMFDYTTSGRIEWQHSDLSLKNASLFMQDGTMVQFALTYCTG